jgi:hypothetical protein
MGVHAQSVRPLTLRAHPRPGFSRINHLVLSLLFYSLKPRRLRCRSLIFATNPLPSSGEILRSMRLRNSCGATTLGPWSSWTSHIPVGIVTDRDIVVGVVAMNLDPRDLTAGDIMSDELVTVPEDYDVYRAMERMRKQGVRRMPVVNSDGFLTGIVSLDDLLPLVAQELVELAKLPSAGRLRECAVRH